MSSQTAEPDHRFAGEQLIPADSEVTRFDDRGIEREGWVRVEMQRKADRVHVRVRDQTEQWDIEIKPGFIDVDGPGAETSVPEWVRDVVTWSAIDPSLTARQVP